MVASEPKASEPKMFSRHNDATSINTNTVNSKHVDIAITIRGSDFYYVICAIIGTVALGVTLPAI